MKIKTLSYFLAGLLGVGVLIWLTSSPTSQNSKPVPFKTTSVIQGDLVVKVSATGVVEPNFQVEVKSKASGEVLQFEFEEGDRVKKGQLLLKLDKSDEVRNVSRSKADLASATAQLNKAKTALLSQKTKYETSLKSARSRVQEAEANLQESQDKLKRQEDLFQKKFASREALQAAQTAFKVNQENLVQARSDMQAAKDTVHDIEVKQHEIALAQAEVQRANIALAEAGDRLEETEIFAPISGILIEKLVQQGQIISSGISNVSGGTALSSIADMSRMFITADVDETDIGAVHIDQQVKVTADAFPGKTFTGQVQRISPKGIVENSITIFKVKIEIQGEGKEILKPMMTANVDIISEELKNVLYLPREAIRVEKNKKYAAILVNNEPKEVLVTTGVRNPIYIQIVSGLKADQKVLTGDWKTLWEEHQKGDDNMSTIRKMLFLLRSK
ncbi:MAG: efflux RND transporter periplasmic adaptor subunit [Nitrospinota bacterium]|nr:efflux RND transporter periplasmic adaptor subunit [Nitrospinota bacterium]